MGCGRKLLIMVLGLAQTALTVAQPAPDDLESAPGRLRSQQQWSLALQAGDWVQGSVQGTVSSLDLRDAQGQAVRRLLGPSAGESEWMFVAPRTANYQLQAALSSPQPATLNVQRVLPQAQQKRLPEPLASAVLQSLAQRLEPLSGPNHAQQRAWVVEQFWQQLGTTPLVEALASPACAVKPADAGAPARPCPVLLTFLWRGASRNVWLLSSPKGEHEALQNLPQTDIWYASYRVPASTHLSYLLAPDVPDLPLAGRALRRALRATAQRDPRNPRVWTQDGHTPLAAGDGESVLSLPAAPPQPWLDERQALPAGQLQRHVVHSDILGNDREVWLYRPAGWREQAPVGQQNVLLVFDAHAYLRTVPTPQILRNLQADGLLGPTAAIIVANPDGESRARELPPNPDFARFLAQELMPWARSQGVVADPAHTVVAGSSYGGLAAAYVALQYPQWWGNVLSLSGSFWWGEAERSDRGSARPETPAEPNWMARAYARAPRQALKFYLEAGLFEGGREGSSILETNRHLRDVLTARGYGVHFAESASGHDYLQWRGGLACGLIALLGPEPAHMSQEMRQRWARACPALP
jgi:enterochelin esterase-like enzyme